MKHAVIIILAVLVVVGVAFWFMKAPAVAPESDPSVSATVTPAGNITVTSPKANAVVGKTITVTGTARTFEQGVNWRLADTAGNKLVENVTTAGPADDTAPGNYSFTINVPDGSPNDLVIWVFEYSAKDGAIVNLVTVPVKIQ